MPPHAVKAGYAPALSSVYSRNDKSDVSGYSVVESMVVVAEV